MKGTIYKRADFETDEFKDALGFYDLFLDYYNNLNEVEKHNFDLGLTLVVNTEFYRQYKRSSINRKLEIIPEIMKFMHHITEMYKSTKFEDNISFDKLSTSASDYSNSNLKSTGKEINSNEEKLTENLFYILNDFFSWLMSKEEINNNIDHSKHREIINVQARANSKMKISSHEIKKQPKLINLKSNYSPSNSVLRNIIDNLIYMGFISNSQKPLLRNVFTGFDLERNEKIIWKKNLGELGYFLRILKEKKIIDYETLTDVCNVASQFFVNKKRDSISSEQILKSRTPNEKSKAMIDKLFN
jgi:hypothetical protein